MQVRVAEKTLKAVFKILLYDQPPQKNGRICTNLLLKGHV